MKGKSIVAALAASVAKPSPDAALIAACEAFRHAWEETDQRVRKRGPGVGAYLRETGPARERLEAFIARTPARTALGRRVKAEAALLSLGTMGTFYELPRSALLDLLHAADGGAGDGARHD